jgi:pentose-5-phosphate-3-epimerase
VRDETVRKLTALPLDVHLMVVEPGEIFDDFVAAARTASPARARRRCPIGS